MANKGPRIEMATRVQATDTKSPISQLMNVSLAITNYVGQIASGAPINSAGPFTVFAPTRLPQIVLGAGGANPVNYTITGTSIQDGTTVVSTIVTATGAGTYTSPTAFSTITSLMSDVNPGGTTDLQAADTFVVPAARKIHVGVAGAINMQCVEDAAVQVIPALEQGWHECRVQRITIASTAATSLVLGW